MSHHAPMRTVAALAAAALTAGGLLLAAPASAATTAVNFNAACYGKFRSLLDTTDTSMATGITVDAPASVVTGQTFTYRLQPNQMTLAKNGPIAGRKRVSVSRLKLDYQVPAGFVSATVVPGTGANLGGVAPTVTRVDEAGNPSASGSILRLSGTQTVGNGPESSDASEGGIVVAAGSGDTNYRLPAVEVTAVGGAAGSVVTPKLRSAGAAANYEAFENFYTSLIREEDPVFGVDYWQATRCVQKNGTSPDSSVPLNAGGGPLATINVVAPPTTTTTTSLAVPATATTGQSVTLSATVAPTQAGGTVQFKDGDANIGAPVPVTAGRATLAHPFTTAGAHSVTAVYSGDTGFLGSTSAAGVVNVSEPTDPPAGGGGGSPFGSS